MRRRIVGNLFILTKGVSMAFRRRRSFSRGRRSSFKRRGGMRRGRGPLRQRIGFRM